MVGIDPIEPAATATLVEVIGEYFHRGDPADDLR
jgi:hypothetical protein